MNRAAVRKLAAILLQVLASALFWHLACGASGGALVVAGIYTLAGAGWALVAAGVCLLALSSYIRRGLNG